MSPSPTAEIRGTASRNEWTTKLLWLCAVFWGIVALDAKELATVYWTLAAASVVCALHPRAGLSTPADTAKRFFRRRLKVDLATEEAVRYAPLFSGVGDPSGVLNRALAEPNKDASIAMLRMAANEWAHALNTAPPFPEEARSAWQWRVRAEQEQARRREQAEANRRQQESYRSHRRQGNNGDYRQQQGHDGSARRDDGLKVALTALGLNSMPPTQSELKRAWKLRLSEYHPDKFAREGEAVRKLAHDMTLQVNKAYEELARSQGWAP